MPSLTGSRVILKPLAASHAAALALASADGDLWKSELTLVPNKNTVDSYIATALKGAGEGTMLPFVITVDNEIIGTTRLWRIDLANRNAEIGNTWITIRYQRSFVNTECKLLLLTHAFEKLNLIRVQFTTHVDNHKSRDAILRLGARQEGIIRNERIMPNGKPRDAIRFSIIDSEWPEIKRNLTAKLAR